MAGLLGIGFLAGLVTAVSPCVLPVLPILLAGGASGRKPLRIITGLMASFVVFTLFATWLLDELGLPEDLLRNLAVALGGGEVAHRLRRNAVRLRAGSGVVIAAVALGLTFHLDDHLTGVVPG